MEGKGKMKQRRTDLAEEARELYEEEGQDLRGVRCEEESRKEILVSRVVILDEEGEKSLGKPCGTYVTLTLQDEFQGENLPVWEEVLSLEIRKLLSDGLGLSQSASVLVVGLGNPAITPDLVGPMVQSQIAVTRHLVAHIPEYFSHLRPVSGLKTGVLATTGVESSEIVRGLVKETSPDCVIAVDALASRKLERVCRTVQLGDTGIIPGSGVGNHRGALNRETLGVPVIAIGVPTVVDGGSLVADLLGEEHLDLEGGDFFVTPKEIDSHVKKLSMLIGKSVNMALNPSLSQEEISILVEG